MIGQNDISGGHDVDLGETTLAVYANGRRQAIRSRSPASVNLAANAARPFCSDCRESGRVSLSPERHAGDGNGNRASKADVAWNATSPDPGAATMKQAAKPRASAQAIPSSGPMT